jgi:hypothetical protein
MTKNRNIVSDQFNGLAILTCARKKEEPLTRNQHNKIKSTYKGIKDLALKKPSLPAIFTCPKRFVSSYFRKCTFKDMPKSKLKFKKPSSSC